MRKFWSNGTVACRPIDNTDLLAFAPYAVATYNLYDYPETITLVNSRGVSPLIIPSTTQVVNKDVVIGWCMPAKKSIVSIVNHYIDRITQVELIINVNMQLQKMPFLVATSEEDADRLKDVVRRILNNEVIVFTGLEDLSRIQALATQTPYIIDKLQAYQQSLERELMTILGLDNIGASAALGQTHINSDQTNANNDEINSYGDAIDMEIKTFVNLINKTFGRNIKVEVKNAPVASVHKTDMGISEERDGGNEDEKNLL